MRRIALLVAVVVASTGCLGGPELPPGEEPIEEVNAPPGVATAEDGRAAVPPIEIHGESRVQVLGVCYGERCLGSMTTTDGAFQVDRPAAGHIVVVWEPSSPFTKRLRVLAPGAEVEGESPLTVPVRALSGEHGIRIWPADRGAMIDQTASWNGTLW